MSYGILCRVVGHQIRRYAVNEDYMDKWISIEDAAEYLGVNKDTVRNWIKKGCRIPANKIGKQWRFKRSDLDAWVKSGQSCFDEDNPISRARYIKRDDNEE